MYTTPHSAARDCTSNRTLDRRTALTGAAGAVLGATLHWPSRAAAQPATPASPTSTGFDPQLARQLQQVLDDAIAASGGMVPGVLLHVASAELGTWTGASGLAQVDPDVDMQPGDRFGVGSIVKPFVATTVLQLVESGALALDATLPEVLPPDVTDRFPQAPDITVRMLLGHRSGLPEWISPALEAEAARDPARVWTESEFLDLAAAQKPLFPPGTDYAYSNTNYTLLGLVIERATGQSWRHEVTERVVTPLNLEATALPAPGDRSLGGPHAHGYVEAEGTLVDVTTVDPSMAGAAGGNSLITSVHDLARFLEELLAGRLFQRPETLQSMLDFQPASGEPGQVGYGLGLLQRVLPGGIETIDHLGGAVGYRTYVGQLTRQGITVALALNNSSVDDPSPFIIPVLGILAT